MKIQLLYFLKILLKSQPNFVVRKKGVKEGNVPNNNIYVIYYYTYILLKFY